MSPPMHRRFRPIRGRRTFACVMLVLSIAVALVFAGLDWWEHTLAGEIAAFNRNPDAPVSGSLLAFYVASFFMGLAQLGIYITTAVAFLMWMHRVASNVLSLGGELVVSPGWAVGYWFIPIANLFMPVRSMLEISKASEPPDEEGEALGLEPPSRTPLIILWWLAWLGMNVLSWVATMSGSWNAQSVGPIRDAAILSIVSEAVAVLAGVLAIVILASVSRRQALLARATSRRTPADAPHWADEYVEAPHHA